MLFNLKECLFQSVKSTFTVSLLQGQSCSHTLALVGFQMHIQLVFTVQKVKKGYYRIRHSNTFVNGHGTIWIGMPYISTHHHNVHKFTDIGMQAFLIMCSHFATLEESTFADDQLAIEGKGRQLLCPCQRVTIVMYVSVIIDQLCMDTGNQLRILGSLQNTLIDPNTLGQILLTGACNSLCPVE